MTYILFSLHGLAQP